MKSAKIDQIMLLMIIFVSIILFAATVSDEMQNRNKYYSLKKITDNAVLTMAKYYININPNQTEAQNVADAMLDQTKLGLEVKDKIIYAWDLANTPATVTATIANYEQKSFWYNFFGKSSFLINAESKAQLISPNSTQNLGSFAINDQDLQIGQEINLEYEIVASWDFDDKNKIYPILLNCACESGFIFSENFDSSDFDDYEICQTIKNGHSTFKNMYIPQLEELGHSDFAISFDANTASGGICLFGSYHGNDNSSKTTQINSVNSAFKNIFDDDEGLEFIADFLLVDENAKAKGIVSLKITSYSTKNGSKGYSRLTATVMPPKTDGNILLY